MAGKVVNNAALVVTGLPFGESVMPGELVGWDAVSHVLLLACGVVGTTIPAVGVAMGVYEAGEAGAIALMAEVSGFAGLVVGATQYLSLDTSGAMQAAMPAGAGNLKQAVGFALAADRMAMYFQDAALTL